MSRPDDPTTVRASQSAPRARTPDQRWRERANVEPGQAPEQWHAREAYHYPGQMGQQAPDANRPAPPEIPRQAPPRARANPAAARPEYAPQFARYGGPQDQRAQAAPRSYPNDAYAPPRAAAPAQRGEPHAPREDAYWSHQNAAAVNGGDGFRPQPELDALRAPPRHRADQAPADYDYQQHGGHHDGHDNLSVGEDHGHDDLLDEYEDEEPAPRRRRGLLYAAALVSAIAVGAGSAVTYKLFIQDDKPRVPVIPNTRAPVKTTQTEAPKPPADSKKESLRPSDTMQTPAAPINTATATSPTAPQAPVRPAVVPGLIVQQPTPPPVAPQAPVAPQPVKTEAAPPAEATTVQPTTRMVKSVPITKDGVPIVPPVEPPTKKPVEVAATKPTQPPKALELESQAPVPPVRPATTAAVTRPAPPVQKTPPQTQPQAVVTPPEESTETEKPIAKKKQLLPKPTPETKAPATTATSTPTGYVVVLSSQKTRGDALRVFADLQQKYPDVLSNRQPEIQGADLDSGHWERLIVGPPASRDAARDLCAKLKAAGHADCWVKGY